MTRPEEASRRFLSDLGTWPGRRVVSPLLDISHVESTPSVRDPRGLVFTSRNAVDFYRGPRDIPAYSIGAATTAAVRAAGLDAQEVGRDAESLLARLPGLRPPMPLLHVRGVHVARAIADELTELGVACGEWVVYDQCARPLSDDARAAFAGDVPVILPVFSPRSARVLAERLFEGPPVAPLVFVAISAAAAAPLTQAWPGAGTLIADAPNAAAMIAALHVAARDVRALEGRPPLP